MVSKNPQGFQYPPATPPKKKGKGCLIALLVVIGVVVLIFIALGVIGIIIGNSVSNAVSSSADISSRIEEAFNSELPSSSMEEATSEEESLEVEPESVAFSPYGSWETTVRVPTAPPMVYEFLEDGTCNWYQTVGSENLMSGTYEIYRGDEAIAKEGYDEIDYMKFLIDESERIKLHLGTFSKEQYYYLVIDFDTLVRDGETTDHELHKEMTLMMRDDNQYIQATVHGEIAQDIYFMDRIEEE